MTEPLRARALHALGPHAPPLARAVLEEARFALEPGVATWESSTGSIRGDRVVLGVSADHDEELRRSPAARDLVCAALANAHAAPGRALFDVRIERATSARGGAPYRDA